MSTQLSEVEALNAIADGIATFVSLFADYVAAAQPESEMASAESVAIAMLAKGAKVVDIAKAVGVARSTLTRSPKFAKYRETKRELEKREARKGTNFGGTVDGEVYD